MSERFDVSKSRKRAYFAAERPGKSLGLPPYALDRLQHGLQPSDSKPMSTIGRGVEEIRIRDTTGSYRVIYIARRADAVYVLHAFQKKSQATAKHDIDLARQRLNQLLRGKP